MRVANGRDDRHINTNVEAVILSFPKDQDSPTLRGMNKIDEQENGF